MPTIRLEKITSLNSSAAFQKISQIIENDPDLRKLDASYQCEFDEETLTGQAKGKQFSAEISVKSNEPPKEQTNKDTSSKVEISVSLPFVLTPLKGVIEGHLRKKLEAEFS